MKAIILHGTASHPDNYWYLWLKKELERAGFTVEVPHRPDMNTVPIDVYLPGVLAEHDFDEETVLIGHSSGVPLILSILENIDVKIAKAVLVAGFVEPLPDPDVNTILQESYDWGKIRAHADQFVILNSDNDPWGCDDTHGRKMFDNLGGTLVIRHDGHFGSNSGDQYKEFPLLKALILEPQL